MKTRMTGCWMLLLFCAAALTGCGRPGGKNAAEFMERDFERGKLIQDVYPNKARYLPGEEVTLQVELSNQLEADWKGMLKFRFLEMEKEIGTGTLDVDLKQGEAMQLKYEWNSPDKDRQGYLVEVTAVKSGKTADHRNTAVDVSSDWSRFPRYGYLCEFASVREDERREVVERLTKYHLNGLQFYDWQDSHDNPLAGTAEAPLDEWKDIAGRPVERSVVMGYLELLQEKGITSAAYNLMFGAYEDYVSRGISPEWGMYQDEGAQRQDLHRLPDSWESDIYLMDPSNPGWQDYLLARTKEAFQVYPFDAFHVDTLGNRGYLYDHEGKEIDLPGGYLAFLERAGQELGTRIVANPVNGYGGAAVAGSGVDFLYTEVWPDQYRSYQDLRRIIDRNGSYCGYEKPTVLAAYMDYGKEGGEFGAHGVKLTDAVIFASGASHMELGDTGMLCSEYFPNTNVTLSAELSEDLRSYYDFLTAYETILYAPDDLEDFGGTVEGYEVSGGEPGTIMGMMSEYEDASLRVIHLINLWNQSYDEWRDEDGNCMQPEILYDLKVSVECESADKVFLASPDLGMGSMLPLDYEIQDGRLTMTVPELHYWDMLVIRQ